MAQKKKKVAVKSKVLLNQKPLRHPALPKEPEYMVQVSDPKMLRKDVLESLRELILFMQSYEKFRKIQEEKIATFNELKADVKSLLGLIENKLRRHFPKGKLHPHQEKKITEEPEHEEESSPIISDPEPKVEVKPAAGELEELESQLKDIERQLQGMN